MIRCSGRFGAPKRLSNARPSGASCACPGDSELGTADLLRATARRQPQPVIAPGVQLEYSNLGFDTAALVVERVTGQPIDVWWRERYFKPLGLQGIYARLARFADWPVPRTPGYQRKGSTWQPFDAYDGEASSVPATCTPARATGLAGAMASPVAA